MKRLCIEIDCHQLTTSTRCDQHQRQRQREQDRRRGPRTAYGSAYRRARAVVLERDGYVCVYCGRPGADTADHVIPVSKGGTSTEDNLVAACRSCNYSKHDR